jgi:hypothetical protein
MTLDIERILFAFQCCQHSHRSLRFGRPQVKRWWIVTVSEKHDLCLGNLDYNRVFGMLSTNVFKLNADLPKLEGQQVIEDYIWNDYMECGPIPNGTRSRCVTYSESRIVFYLLAKILPVS